MGHRKTNDIEMERHERQQESELVELFYPKQKENESNSRKSA
jgi:hypothetical protein